MPIIIEEQSNRRRRTILGSIAAGFILAFLIAFWGELRDVLLMIVQIPNGFTSERFDSLLNLGYNLQWFVLFALAWIVLVSFQALLPAGSFADYLRTAYQFIVYIFGQHGPAVFVKDGKVLSTREDVRDGPGVAVVDFNSAIVLEERLPPPGIGSGYDSAMHRFFWSLGLADKAESPRVMGPGIVYTRSRERIRAAIDLRRQFRMVRGINGYSRNGIEVSTNVWAIFTVGQDPDVVQVTYDGEARPENLRVVNFEALPDGHLRMVSMSDELDRQDRQEIHHHFQVLRHTREIYPYKKIDPPNPLPVFDRDRVFAAVFSEARGERDEVVPWYDLPGRLATSVFREIISQVNYDDLYQGGNPLPLPLTRYKARLRQTMRNYGLLSYRLVFPHEQEHFEIRRVYRESDLRVSETRPLMTSKILRDRGIKVIASGFGDILPVSPQVYSHRLASWKAPWERDQAVTEANSELEATRVRARARAKAQEQITYHLNQIMHAYSSPEVAAIRMLESLDQLASHPRTMQLLNAETLSVLKNSLELLRATPTASPAGDAGSSTDGNNPLLPGPGGTP